MQKVDNLCSWAIVAIIVLISMFVFLVIESDMLGNAVDQYFQIGAYDPGR